MAIATMPAFDDLRDQCRRYYDGRLRQFGETPRGVDWSSLDSQLLRFQQFDRLLTTDRDASVLDYGCGYGALAEYLRGIGHRGPYAGFDISTDMVQAARQRAEPLTDCRFSTDPHRLGIADYTLASGVFNVKMDAAEAIWREYLLSSIAEMRHLSRRGFAFNVLTAGADVDRRRADLFYADPIELFEHCRRAYSPHVALLHDYGLYEFTVLVRL